VQQKFTFVTFGNRITRKVAQALSKIGREKKCHQDTKLFQNGSLEETFYSTGKFIILPLNFL